MAPDPMAIFLATIPLISRTMLAQRLKELAAAGVIQPNAKEKGRGHIYVLTEAGEAFRPMIEMMGEWGLKWGGGLVGPDDLDSKLLIGGIRQHIDRKDIPAQEFVLHFDFRGIPKGSRNPRHWWLLIRKDEIEVCLKDPGQNRDVVIEPTWPPLQRSGPAIAVSKTPSRDGSSRSAAPSLQLLEWSGC